MCIHRSRVCERHAAARIVPAQTYIMYYIIVAYVVAAKLVPNDRTASSYILDIMFYCWSANLITQYNNMHTVIILLLLLTCIIIMMRCRRVDGDVRNSDVSFGGNFKLTKTIILKHFYKYITRCENLK